MSFPQTTRKSFLHLQRQFEDGLGSFPDVRLFYFHGKPHEYLPNEWFGDVVKSYLGRDQLLGQTSWGFGGDRPGSEHGYVAYGGDRLGVRRFQELAEASGNCLGAHFVKPYWVDRSMQPHMNNISWIKTLFNVAWQQRPDVSLSSWRKGFSKLLPVGMFYDALPSDPFSASALVIDILLEEVEKQDDPTAVFHPIDLIGLCEDVVALERELGFIADPDPDRPLSSPPSSNPNHGRRSGKAAGSRRMAYAQARHCLQGIRCRLREGEIHRLDCQAQALPYLRSIWDYVDLAWLGEFRLGKSWDTLEKPSDLLPRAKYANEVREWVEKLRTQAGSAPSAVQAEETRSVGSDDVRPAYQRDHRWLGWHKKEGLGAAKIRDRWNAMSDQERQKACPSLPQKIGKGEPGRDVVKKALKRAEKEVES